MLMKDQSKVFQIILEAAGDSLLRSTFSQSTDGKAWLWQGSASQKLKDQVEEWLKSYFAKKPLSCQLPLAVEYGSSFDQAVWKQLQQIPFGKTLSYGEIAQAMGHPKAARAVGNACGRNPFMLFIPCHRVIASSGKLGGFAGGPDVKVALLSFEGQNFPLT